MTPKQKAEELFDKYFTTGYAPNVFYAKQSALVAVDEILYMLKNGLYDTNIKGDEYDGGFDMTEYWEEVKQEIKKL
jgi:hypothetical protein